MLRHRFEAVVPQESELVTIWHHQNMTENVNGALEMVPNSLEEAIAVLDSYGIDMETLINLFNTLGLFGGDDPEEL